MHQTKRYLLLMTTLLVSGCVMRGAIAPDYVLQNKKMAVVSELGNHFQYVTIGTTMLTNNIHKADVRDWKINHLAASHLMHQLQKRHIQADEIESDFFTALDDRSAYTISTVKDNVIKKVKSLGYQSVLIVSPTPSQNFPLFKPGYGLNTRYFFGSPQSCIYAMYTLELYDLEKDQTVGWEWVNANHGPCIFNSANDIPVKEKFDQFTPKEKQEIRTRLEQWIKTSLDATLQSMHLAQ